VPGIVVADPTGATDPGGLAERVGSLVGDTIGGVPQPVVAHGRSVTVLLPLVDPADAALAAATMRAQLADLTVTRTTMTADDLAALGPLAGRLHPATGGGA